LIKENKMKTLSSISFQSVRSLIAISLREVWERRTTYAASAAFGVIPILILAFDGFGLAPGREVAALLAGVIFTALTGGIALMSGTSIIGRELTQRRLGFYFARPVSGFAIWVGKFLGGLLLTLTAPLLSLIPSAILVREQLGGFMGG